MSNHQLDLIRQNTLQYIMHDIRRKTINNMKVCGRIQYRLHIDAIACSHVFLQRACGQKYLTTSTTAMECSTTNLVDPSIVMYATLLFWLWIPHGWTTILKLHNMWSCAISEFSFNLMSSNIAIHCLQNLIKREGALKPPSRWLPRLSAAITAIVPLKHWGPCGVSKVTP